MAFMLGMFAFANNSVENPVEQVTIENVVTLENALVDLQTSTFPIYYTSGGGSGSGMQWYDVYEDTTMLDVINDILEYFF